MLVFWPLSSSIFNPTWPHLGPQVGPYKPFSCPSFSDHHSNSISDFILDRFRTPNRFQNRSKIDQKFIPKSSYKQVVLQLHLRSNFEDNLMFKPNGRCSKIVLKHRVLYVFQTSAHARQSKQATCNAFKHHQKPYPKSIPFSSKLNAFSIIFGIDFQVRNLGVLGKVLGSISDHVGVQNDVRTASKSSRKQVPT